VVVATAAGSGSAPLTIQPNATVAIAGDVEGAPGDPIAFTVGSPQPGVAWLVMSAFPGATALPGLVELSIGGGNPLSLSIVGSGVLNAAGNWTRGLAVPPGPGLSGLTIQLEGVTLDLGGAFSATGAHAFTVL